MERNTDKKNRKNINSFDESKSYITDCNKLGLWMPNI